MRRFSPHARTGLESEGGEDDVSLGSTEPVDMSEFEAEASAISEHAREVSDANEAVMGLEAIAMGIQSTLKGRGLDRNAAMFAHIATAAYCDRLQMRNPLPAMEAFGSTTSQLTMTRAGLEDVKQKIQDAWKWIIDLLQTGIRKVNEYYQRVWAQAPRLIAKAQAISKKVSELKTGKSKDGKNIEVDKSSFSTVHVAKAVTGAGLLEGMKQLESISGDIFVDYVKQVADWGDKVVTSTTDVDYADDDRFNASVSKIMEHTIDVTKLVAAATETSPAGPNAGGKETPEIMGGKKIFVKVGTDASAATEKASGTEDAEGAPPPEDKGGKGAENAAGSTAGATVDLAAWRGFVNPLSDTRVYLGSAYETQPEFSEKSVPTFEAQQIAGIAVASEALCTIIMNYKAGNKRANDLRQKAITAAKRAQTNAVKADDLSKDNATVAGQLNKVVAVVNTLLTQPNQEFSAHMLRVTNVCLQLCEKSLANYK